DQLDPRLLLGRQRLQPRLDRLLRASQPDPERLARLVVADDRDVTLLALAPPAQVLLINADLAELGLRPRREPPRQRVLLGPSHGGPVHSVFHGDVLHRHRGRFQGQMLLQTLGLALIPLGPGDQLDRRALARLTPHPAGRIRQLRRPARPRQVQPPPLCQLLMNAAALAATPAATLRPATLQPEDQPRRDGRVVPRRQGQSLAASVFQPGPRHAKAPVAKHLRQCHTSFALPHPSPPSGLSPKKKTSGMSRSRWGSASSRKPLASSAPRSHLRSYQIGGGTQRSRTPA